MPLWWNCAPHKGTKTHGNGKSIGNLWNLQTQSAWFSKGHWTSSWNRSSNGANRTRENKEHTAGQTTEILNVRVRCTKMDEDARHDLISYHAHVMIMHLCLYLCDAIIQNKLWSLSFVWVTFSNHCERERKCWAYELKVVCGLCACGIESAIF